MNELQQVLLIFAIIVIAGLYILQKIKAKRNSSAQNPEAPAEQPNRDSAEKALNELGEAHIPLSQQTQHRLHMDDEEEVVPDSQLGLSFGQEFEKPKPTPPAADVEETAETEERKPRHVVLEAEDIHPVGGVEEGASPVGDDDYKPSFGIPEGGVNTPETEVETELKDPQVFAIIVMGTDDFLWPKVNQTLQGVGLVPSEQGIFVKKDSMGNEIIRVANLMEPGTFPLDQPTNSELKTAGVVLILELPTTVKAPAVMHDMIMMSRKISQRLNGRLYDAERHLLKESDLQAMRDAAVAYESAAI
ncbi:cell division-like protein [Thiomicrospira sp. XS5]|uniref:cell division protein ZipA C-terminal FtsZ-binding domain-containing protein n=1 Tax=Thiomicrospira sp. XS5 TaxID=1775636 RepID=UPI0007462FBA|nr:cell division protein ZipA C-terminal FtsZ-binding domain-containing protein [Thiomicrospira sp. XS5]KUJ75310.1 cell division-like protein [Thiomicrospira sp. XS5]